MDDLAKDPRFDTRRINRIAQKLRDTKTGAPLIEFGIMKNVRVVLSSGMTTAAYYSEPVMGDPEIELNADCDDAVLTVALAHELRHVEQRVVQPRQPLEMPPLDAVKLTRIFEADASAYSAGVAYEIFQKTGDRQYLDALEIYGEDDIRDAFIAAASKDCNLREDVAPFRAAFDQWFNKPERVQHYDRAAIRGYSAGRNNVLSRIFCQAAAPLTTEMLKDISTLSAKANYLADTGLMHKVLQSERYMGGISAPVLRLAGRLAAAPG